MTSSLLAVDQLAICPKSCEATAL